MMLRAYLATGLCLALVLAACAPAPADSDTAPPSATVPSTIAAIPTNNAGTDPDDSPDSDVIATVNGVSIPRADYEALLARRQSNNTATDQEALATFVLELLINQELVRQGADDLGVSVTPAEVDAEVDSLKQIVEGDEAAFRAWLSENNYTSEAAFRDELRAQLLASKVRDAVVGDTAEQTERQVHARHILVQSEAQATELREQLQNGASFVELAAAHSRDVTTRDQGGDLGWFTEGELLEPRIAEAALSQPEGTISEPITTRLGYHLVETLAFDDLPVQPEKQAQVAQALFDEWLRTQNDSAIIEIYR